jgi:hypothetical protein
MPVARRLSASAPATSWLNMVTFQICAGAGYATFSMRGSFAVDVDLDGVDVNQDKPVPDAQDASATSNTPA